ncbi:MAG TPA: hypothetical protein EYG03_10370 [Planctomycetes bacterium]|nr:hypothetical protein [Fuerstiella sp.]HIK92371.1 hypothetical protein [Planctomycetota bacterium]
MSLTRTLHRCLIRMRVMTGCLLIMTCAVLGRAEHGWADDPAFELKVQQVTSGSKHHFFGYIGQCRTIPWNASDRYILGMEIEHIDRMPKPDEAAVIILVDTHQNNKIIRLDKTHAWNPQQGTMFYWNPLAAETQFIFNDRDVKTGKVFAVLYDIEKRKRIKEFRDDQAPIGNGGFAQNGGAFLGINYGRLARLRAVTGYPETLDWSKQDNAPKNDGIFVVDIKTGVRRLLVSYRQLADKLRKVYPDIDDTALFINHTLWNRTGDRVYFFARGNWDKRSKGRTKINKPFSIHIDGTGLTMHDRHIGGHPEWAEDHLLIGRRKADQILYDVDKQEIVGQLGTPDIFPNPEGDISLSPDGTLFANGYKKGNENYFVVYRRSDGAWVRSKGLDKGEYSGDIRIDPAPRWNRANNAILVPGLAENKTRQMFMIQIVARRDDLGGNDE